MLLAFILAMQLVTAEPKIAVVLGPTDLRLMTAAEARRQLREQERKTTDQGLRHALEVALGSSPITPAPEQLVCVERRALCDTIRGRRATFNTHVRR
jgi:hypothetical protein